MGKKYDLWAAPCTVMLMRTMVALAKKAPIELSIHGEHVEELLAWSQSDYENGRRTYSDTMAKRLSAVLKVKEDHLKYGSGPKQGP